MRRVLQSTLQVFVILLSLLCTAYFSNAQYCTPTVSYNCTYGSYQMWVNNFSTTGGSTNITNNNSQCGNASTSYTYYSKLMHAGIQGTPVNFSITCGNNYPMGVKIWIDYNMDGDFVDAGENVYAPTATQAATTTATGSFIIPAASPTGVTRMRVRCSYSTTTFDPCNSQSYGETEDYVFEVIPSCIAKVSDPANQQACENYGAAFPVTTASADSVNWQRFNGTSWVFLGDDAHYTGTNTKTMSIKNLTYGWNGYQYRPVVFNKANNCSVNGKVATLTMVPTTTASIVIAPNPGDDMCDGSEATLYSAWTNGGLAPTYQWRINSQPIPGATNGSFKTKALKKMDTVTCVFSSSAICVYPEVSNSVIFNINPMLKPEVSLTSEYMGGSSYKFTANPENVIMAPVYQWFRNNKVVANENTDTYLPTDMVVGEKVYVQLISKDKCVDPADKLKYSEVVVAKVAITGITANEQEDMHITLHPNPNSGRFNIVGSFNTTATEDAKITITNTLGQVIANYSYHVENGKINLPVNIETAPNGVYSVNISLEHMTTTTKFVLAR